MSDAMFAALPTVEGPVSAVVGDPPWRFKSNSVVKPGRNAMRCYGCMTPDDIAAIPVIDIAAENAALFLWVPGPFLVIDAHIPVMRAWGFEPCASGFVWIKQIAVAASTSAAASPPARTPNSRCSANVADRSARPLMSRKSS